MSEPKDGGPAFGQVVELRCVRVDPSGATEWEPEAMLHGGLTVRDYFAAKAMQALIAKHGGFVGDIDEVSEYAYSQADAMIKARKA